MENLLAKATRQGLRDHNSRLVLRTIYDYGAISRVEVAYLTHLTRATVSTVVSDLIEQGLVEEAGSKPGAVGRTPILLSVAPESRNLVVVNVTDAAIHGAVADLRGTLGAQVSLPYADARGEALLALLWDVVGQLIQSARRPLLGIGISTPGLVDAGSGTVVRALNLGWRDVGLRSLLHARYATPVYVIRDTHALALAEYMFGRSPTTSSLIAIEAGRGVGAGIVLNGQLFYGDGYGAGEIGHVVVVEDGLPCTCGNRGCLETVASTKAILDQARALAQASAESPLHAVSGELDIEAVAQASAAGDRVALGLVETLGRHLAVAAANLVAALNIQRIVLTGPVAAFGQPLHSAIRRELDRRVLPVLARATEIELVDLVPETVLRGSAAQLLLRELGLARLAR